MAKSLPQFIPPMLAVHGQAFDSDAHFFEFKWDGFRAAAMIEGGSVRLMSRNRNDLSEQFPVLASLGKAFPGGLALDGEIVAFRDGKPSFDLMLNRGRHGGRRAGSTAVKYVVFDVLYRDFEPRMDLPFTERRAILEEVAAAASGCPELLLSDGVTGTGKSLYQQACEQSLEGIVAKKLSSPYAAGKRNGAWIKIKRRLRIQVVVIGWIEKPGNDFQSLLVAGSQLQGEEPGPLRFLGRVGGGFTQAMREKVFALLQGIPRSAPLVACGEKGRWVEPRVFCEVSYAELTEAGQLRAPVFEGLIES